MSHPSRDVTGLLNPTPPAGSIPVRLRCEIRAVTSMDARGEPASRAGETGVTVLRHVDSVVWGQLTAKVRSA